ncbi:MAG: hypothetical protein ABI315_03660 [Bacteroidia bacterium]
MKQLINFKFTFLIAILLLVSEVGMAQKKKVEKNKFLEGKIFNVQFYEMKTSGRGKALKADVITKNGKVQCDLMQDKLSLPPVNYTVTQDSVFQQDGEDVQLITFEANFKEDKNTYEWQATITGYDIEGTVIQKKNDVEKKKYEFSGSEKPKKAKKK